MEHIKPYKKDFDYSYALGASPTFELIGSRPEMVRCVFYRPSFTEAEKLRRVCSAAGIPVYCDEKTFTRISGKENCFAAGIFVKYTDTLDGNSPHTVLVNPSDMGNIGTVIRDAAGFFTPNIAIIDPAADHFNPKTVRASMGAFFKVKIARYPSFDAYRADFPRHDIFPFMLSGRELNHASCPQSDLYSLIFGNESAGLPANFAEIGTPLKILQSPQVDSLNLSAAAAVGMFLFASARPRGGMSAAAVAPHTPPPRTHSPLL